MYELGFSRLALRLRRALAAALLLVVAAPALCASPVQADVSPRLAAGRVDEFRNVPDFHDEFNQLLEQQRQPEWFGYAVPAVDGQRRICCFSLPDPGSGVCRLERNRGVAITAAPSLKNGIKPQIFILYRIENGRLTDLRTFTPDCQLDPGDVKLVWYTDVTPRVSIELLTDLVLRNSRELDAKSRGSRRIRPKDIVERAIIAIALHDSPTADAALEALLSEGFPLDVRAHAAYWLAEARGRTGYERVRRLVREEKSGVARERFVFALSASHDEHVIQDLIRTGLKDRSGAVRAQALFWLAQRAPDGCRNVLHEAIDSDPDPAVKEKAIYALSQLPGNKGIPILIELARSHPDRRVRERTTFWLSQSRDPRAIEFFEQSAVTR
ncbi:MAG: HEAT repeat domain-containing protein [Thermoanaerobaculia bacterium]